MGTILRLHGHVMLYGALWKVALDDTLQSGSEVSARCGELLSVKIFERVLHNLCGINV